MILGVDVGGTFTDLVLLDDAGQVRIHKLLTSAHDPSQAIVQGIAEIGAGPDAAVVHGATVATNALLERRGARTALITSAGFGDVLEIGRQTRPDLYALHPTRPAPLVPERWRFELPERVDCHGAVVVPLDIPATDAAIGQILAEGIESVAVCFLFSFLYPEHERRVGARIAELGGADAPFVSLSCEVVPEYREYERTSTTAINAYVAPLMSRYLAKLELELGGRRLRIMQSNGGTISTGAARRLAARTALSGPAGGVVGAFELARQAGLEQAITFDMGGTSTDVSLCPGRIQETAEGAVAGLPLRLPIIDIHTVGAGGGSIAHLDAGGALRVGPHSAGADPGPVCYGRGDQITVTDANLILGRLDAGHPLGGQVALDLPRTQARMQELARRLSLPLEAAAWGVIRVANSNMERAIRTISVERGHDPRRFTLVAFGGAGPLHACELAAALQIPRVLIPPHPGVLSALGMILADVVKDYSQTVMVAAGAGEEQVVAALERLAEMARGDLLAEGLAEEEMVLEPALDMRYAGQSYELTIPVSSSGFRCLPLHRNRGMSEQHQVSAAPVQQTSEVLQAFHAAHRQRFSYASEGEPVEIVNVRLKATGRTAKPSFTKQPLGGTDPRKAQSGYKTVCFADAGAPHAARPLMTALYERERLVPGNVVVGPAILFQLDTTTAIPPDWAATVDGWGNLVVDRQQMVAGERRESRTVVQCGSVCRSASVVDEP
jgi:N-methylhydantoinase A